MGELNTISSSKEAFYKEFPYVIPHVYRRISDEILVELHLLSHQKGFEADKIFAVGLTSAFNQLTLEYEPKQHVSLLFKALCNCNNIDPNRITSLSEITITSNKGLTRKQIENCINDKKESNSLFPLKNKVYTRITVIGLLSIISEVFKDETKKESTKEATIKIATNLGLSKDRVEKDIDIYQLNLDKIKQSLELIKLINKEKTKQ